MRCIKLFPRVFKSINAATGQTFELSCGSWRCEKHYPLWAKKWGIVVSRALDKFNPRKILLLNLTTAEMTDNKAAKAALREFVRVSRETIDNFQYVKVVEYNVAHTQPHFHLILAFDTLIIPELPVGYSKKLSYPGNLFDRFQEIWRIAMAKYSGNQKQTTVIWLQPPGNQAAAANYAVKYAVGKPEKNEQPDYTWQGRKLSYSKYFLFTTAKHIYEQFLDEIYPNRHNQILGLCLSADVEDEDLAQIRHLVSLRVLEMLKLGQPHTSAFLRFTLIERIFAFSP